MRWVATFLGAAALVAVLVVLGTHFAQEWLLPRVPLSAILLGRMVIGFAAGSLVARAIIRRAVPQSEGE